MTTSLTYELANDVFFGEAFPMDKPAPVPGDADFTIFNVDTSLERGQRRRKLSHKAVVSRFYKKPKTDVDNICLLCDEFFTALFDLPIRPEDLQTVESAFSTLSKQDLKELDLPYF